MAEKPKVAASVVAYLKDEENRRLTRYGKVVSRSLLKPEALVIPVYDLPVVDIPKAWGDR